MKPIFNSIYTRYFVGGLILILVASWCSIGFHHPDEHYQILEFANYKLNHTPERDLPWEFAKKMRPALQPFIAYCCMWLFQQVGIQNPFTVTFLFRLLVGLLYWFISCKLVLLLISDFKTQKGKIIFILLSFFLWFVPYISVRFSSENTAALCFLFSVYLLLKPYTNPQQKNRSFLLIGGLLALSFFFRFQMAFAFAGIGLWLLLIQKSKLQHYLYALFSFLFFSAICLCIDRWFYHSWEFTPYNYFKSNILDHAADKFGIFPWWYYFVFIFNFVVPPISIVLLYFLGIGILKKKTHLFSLVILFFFIGHAAVGHKELRFLFPVLFGFTYLIAIGIDNYIQKYKGNKITKVAYVLLLVMNMGLLLYRSCVPPLESILCLRHISYTYTQPLTLLSLKSSIYTQILEMNFYRQKNITELVVKDEHDLDHYLQAKRPSSTLLYVPQPKLGYCPIGYEAHQLYCIYPQWIITYFNFNDWASRANVYSLYELQKK
ncbi:MAG: hypothetical protein JST67_02290 [Bacteroidetes bacterium]|nr:hypothetical protein [Bacteroidota bacterium]